MLRPRVLVLSVLGIGAGAAIAAAGVLTAGGAVGAGTCSIYWTGATNTAWNTATNWSLSDGGPSAGAVPAATDFVCMSTAPTRSAVVAASANRTIAGIRFAATGSVTPSLNLQGGTFTLNTNDSVINNLVATGTIAGTAPLTVTGAGSFTSLALTGATKTVATGATYTSSGTVTVGTTGASTTLVDAGSLTLNGTTLQISTVTNGVSPNALTVSGTLALTNSASITTLGANVVKPTTVSTGTVTVGGTGRKTIGTAFSSSGTITVTTGTLALLLGPVPSAPDTGTISVASAATLEYAGSRTVAAGTISGAGTVLVSGGTTTFGSGTTLPNLTVTGGTVSGSLSIGVLTATSGTFAGSGTATVTGTGSTLCALTITTGYRVVNQGSATYNANCGYLELDTAGVFENSGSLAVVAGNAGYYIADDNNVNNAFLNDAGATLTVTASNANTVIRVATPFSNAGTVNLVTGKLQLNAGSAAAGADTGTYSVPTGTQLTFNGGARNIGAATLSGAGTFVVSGGTVTFASGVSLPNLTLSGGTIAGSPAIGALTGTNGTFTGTGTATVSGPATFCQITLAGGYRLKSQGTSTYDADCGYIEFAGGSTFENAGSLTVTNGANGYSFYDDDNDPANAVVNDAGATFTVAAGGPAVVVRTSVAFSNAGTVNVNVGRFTVNAGSVPGSPDTGTYNVAAGARIVFGAGTRTVGAATLAGAGVFEVAGGTVAFSNGVTLPNLTFSGGTITGSPSIGVLTATSGTFSGSGTATLTGAGSTITALALDTGYRLLNQGALTYQAGGDYLYVYDNSQLENAGSLTLTGPTGYAIYNNGSNTTALLNDAGATITVNLGANANYLSVNAKFTNNGTVTAVRGALRIDTITNLSAAGVLTGGTWTAAGGTIGFPRSIVTNAATTTLGATGGLTVGSSTTGALVPLASNSGTLTIGQTLTGTASFSNTGTVAVTGGTWRVTTYTQTAGSTTVASGAILKSGTTGTAAVAVNGGVLAGGGTVQGAVAGVGTIQPGTGGSGTLTVTGTWNAAPATTLVVSAGATSTSLAVSGAVAVNGTLAITTVQPTPAVGTSVTVVSAGSLTGTFATVTGVDVPGSNAYWVVGYTPTSVTVTLTAYPQVSVTGGSVVEGNVGTGSLPFTVTLSAASPQPVTVAYATADGTASAATDYAATSGSLTFTPGMTTKTVSVTTVGDTLYEGDETVQLVLSAPSGAVVGTGTASGTISDDDAAPAVSVGPASGTVGAGTGASLVFPVSLSAVSGLDVTVDYATSDGTAVAPADYTATSGTLVIPAGSTTASVAVAAPAQAGYAPPKTFTVTLSNPVRATLGTASATGTISNSNPAGGTPTVASVSPSSAGQASSVSVVITGSNLPSNATVSVSGTGVTVTNVVVSTTARITATFTATAAAAPGARDVTVNGTAGPATCAACFTVTARPTVAQVSRTAFALGNLDAQVDVTGVGYQPGTTLRLVKGTRTIEATSVTVDSATALTAYLSIANNAVLGTYNVVLANPDGGTTTCAGCVTVYAAPKVTSVSPSSVAKGTATTMTFTGTGFVSGARLSVQGATLSNVVFVNSTTVTATVTFPANAVAGSKAVKVFNPASAGSGTGTTAAAVTVTA